MHCYQTFAATTLIADMFEDLPGIGRKPSHAEIADWMAQNGIEAEDILYIAPGAARAKLVGLVKQNRPRISRAA